MKRGVLKVGFDRVGTSTAAQEDAELDFSDVADIRRSRWFYGFKTAAKRVISMESQRFVGTLKVVCIYGAPTENRRSNNSCSCARCTRRSRVCTFLAMA